MSFEELCKLAATYNKSGDRIPKDAPKKIQILGLLPSVATAKLTECIAILHEQVEGADRRRPRGRKYLRQVRYDEPNRAMVDAGIPR